MEIVKRSYDGINDAYKTGDYLRPIEEVCHPDVVLRTSGMFPEIGEYHGYDGLGEFTRNQAEAFNQMWASRTRTGDLLGAIHFRRRWPARPSSGCAEHRLELCICTLPASMAQAGCRCAVAMISTAEQRLRESARRASY